MAQTGIEAPYNDQVGRIFTDRYTGNNYDCDFDGCDSPCSHCAQRCSGKLSWTKEDFTQERTVYCTGPDKHPYKVIQSG